MSDRGTLPDLVYIFGSFVSLCSGVTWLGGSKDVKFLVTGDKLIFINIFFSPIVKILSCEARPPQCGGPTSLTLHHWSPPCSAPAPHMAWDTMLGPGGPRGCEDPLRSPQRLPPGMELSAAAYRYHHGHHPATALNMVDFYQSCKSEYWLH